MDPRESMGLKFSSCPLCSERDSFLLRQGHESHLDWLSCKSCPGLLPQENQQQG